MRAQHITNRDGNHKQRGTEEKLSPRPAMLQHNSAGAQAGECEFGYAKAVLPNSHAVSCR